jgi:hypothetical protein
VNSTKGANRIRFGAAIRAQPAEQDDGRADRRIAEDGRQQCVGDLDERPVRAKRESRSTVSPPDVSTSGCTWRKTVTSAPRNL